MIKKLCFAAAIVGLAMPLVHPFGPVRKQRSNALTEVPPQIERACQNCHSQRTEWPLYSHLPLVSWAIEKDVAEARQRLDFSRWNEYSNEEKRDLLARIVPRFETIKCRSHVTCCCIPMRDFRTKIFRPFMNGPNSSGGSSEIEQNNPGIKWAPLQSPSM